MSHEIRLVIDTMPPIDICGTCGMEITTSSDDEERPLWRLPGPALRNPWNEGPIPACEPKCAPAVRIGGES